MTINESSFKITFKCKIIFTTSKTIMYRYILYAYAVTFHGGENIEMFPTFQRRNLSLDPTVVVVFKANKYLPTKYCGGALSFLVKSFSDNWLFIKLSDSLDIES